MSNRQVMGILNVTPDSFSDGGTYFDAELAIARGQQMVQEGAHIVDVGGESTRPGADPVSIDEELNRTIPVVTALASEVTVSIDTRHAEVAAAAVDAGASIINDVSASLAGMAAAKNVGWVAMHMKGDPRSMQSSPSYDDVTSEVLNFLLERAQTAKAQGVPTIWIDPGIGFGKTTRHNLQLLRSIGQFTSSDWPVVVGASRKRFLGELTGRANANDRLSASLTAAVWCWSHGVDVMRVHDVKETVRALTIFEAMEAGGA